MEVVDISFDCSHADRQAGWRGGSFPSCRRYHFGRGRPARKAANGWILRDEWGDSGAVLRRVEGKGGGPGLE